MLGRERAQPMAQAGRSRSCRDYPPGRQLLPTRNLQTHKAARDGISSPPGHWSAPTTPTFGDFYDHDDYYGRRHQAKKSIFVRVKEKAKKWRQMLVKKRNKPEEENVTPPWGVSLHEGDEEEDTEYHGVPKYESETTSDTYDDSSSENNSTIHYPSPCDKSTITQLSPTDKETEMKQANDMRNQPSITYQETEMKQANDMRKQPSITYKETEMKQANDVRKQPSTTHKETEITQPSITHKVTEITQPSITHKVTEITQPSITHKETEMKPANDVRKQPSTTLKETEMKQANDVSKQPSTTLTGTEMKQANDVSKQPSTTLKGTEMKQAHVVRTQLSTTHKETEMKQANDVSKQPSTTHKETEMKQANDVSKQPALDHLGEIKLILTPETTERPQTAKKTMMNKSLHQTPANNSGDNSKTLSKTVLESLAPAYAVVSDATQATASKIQESGPRYETAAKQVWDKGVLVKEYLMHKLEPREEDRALCEVINEAVSPRNISHSLAEARIVANRKEEAVASSMGKEVAEKSPILISTNPHSGKIKTGGRTLEAYTN